MFWPKLPNQKVQDKVFEALADNLNYRDEKILGLPATYLDQEQFYFDAPFLKNAAFLSVLINNPNHIGCHTHSKGESYFKGTQQLEIDLIRICAEEIFGAEKYQYDGYVTSGGTEANIQAQWVYRNHFQKEKNARPNEIAVLCSEDAHYSAYKGSNLLGIKTITVPVDQNRHWSENDLIEKLHVAQKNNIKYLIVHLSMGTTMFGSVDSSEWILKAINQIGFDYFVHVDAAFGGFIYPFTSENIDLTFKNPEISSITIDGHKMLQTPYGTGIFLCKKNLITSTQTEEASYVQGSDFTLCGSRSGANAVAVWMVLMTHGSEGWRYKMRNLIDRADHICKSLKELGISFYRNPDMNIIAIQANQIPDQIADKYHLVADNFDSPKWWKIVVMPHLEKHIIDEFLNDLHLSFVR